MAGIRSGILERQKNINGEGTLLFWVDMPRGEGKAL